MRSDHADRPAEVGAAGDPARAAAPVVVRRHAGVAALVGVAASAVAIAYLWRASWSSAALDWALFGAMALVAGYHLATLVDARTPLLVADGLGVRIRLGQEWRGLPWDAVAQVVLHPPQGPLRDGRLVFVPHSLARALEGLDARGRRHVSLNQRLYGAALAVPWGGTTRVSSRGQQRLVEELSALAVGRAEVVEVAEVQPGPVVREPRRRLLRAAGTFVSRAGNSRAGNSRAGNSRAADSRAAPGRSHDVDLAEQAPSPAPAAAPLSPAVALRETRPGRRAEVSVDLPTAWSAALDPVHDERSRAGLPEGRELRRPGSVDLVFEPVGLDDRVRPISSLGDAVTPLVIDDFVTEPAYDPVIGPELAAARTRLGLSVDELAERTRIRAHVIESIEVDDFAACGGDFYARGHLRTLARILGKDVAPILASFEERYATAPVNARRVFEAELATGMTGSMRSTVGGPSWGLLVGAVLGLVLVWGVVRLFTAEPVETLEMPLPALTGSAEVPGAVGVPGAAGVDPGYPAAPWSLANAAVDPVTVRLTASQADTDVVVRDGAGRVVFTGALVLGERKTLELVPPVRVRAADGGAVEIRVAGRDRGLLGQPGEPVRRTFR